jgi:hypothetical protein
LIEEIENRLEMKFETSIINFEQLIEKGLAEKIKYRH